MTPTCELVVSDQACEDYLHWQDHSDGGKVPDRVNELINVTSRSFFKGNGKPEPLKVEFSGW